MIVLDTNVLSETLKPRPEPQVLAWVNSVPPSKTAITVVTVAEILYGVGRLPNGARRAKLMAAAEAIFDEDFRGRILAFDTNAAGEYARLVVEREAAGLPISMADAQIAAICRVHECTLATRNTEDFTRTGITVANPWTDPSPAVSESSDPKSADSSRRNAGRWNVQIVKKGSSHRS